jgi:cytochrome b
MDAKRIALWDLPTRIFHWALVVLIVAAYTTAQIGGAAIDWHARIGLSILGLVVFRLIWGLIGSSHARFASFFPTPGTLRAYLRGQWRGVGHNPLGAFSVFGMLGLIMVQFGTGLFANDDIAFEGPLAKLISKELSDRLTGIHLFSINLLIALIVLHLAAIFYYVRFKKETLIKPMLTGWKDIEPGQGESATGGGAVAFIVALAIALAAVYGASGAWLAKPAAAPASVPAKAPW